VHLQEFIASVVYTGEQGGETDTCKKLEIENLVSVSLEASETLFNVRLKILFSKTCV
jgi:hypothetical protein